MRRVGQAFLQTLRKGLIGVREWIRSSADFVQVGPLVGAVSEAARAGRVAQGKATLPFSLIVPRAGPRSPPPGTPEHPSPSSPGAPLT